MPITAWYYIADCVSLVVRVTLLDLLTIGLSEQSSFLYRGLTVSHLILTILS